MKTKGDKMQSAAQKAVKAVSRRMEAGEGVSTVQRLLKTGASIDIGQGTEIDPKTGRSRPITFQRVMDAPLHQLFMRGSLGKPDDAKLRYEAGKRLYEHWYQSGMAGNVRGVDLNSVGGGMVQRGPWPASEAQAYHREQWRSGAAALGNDRTATLVALIVINEVDPIKAGRGVYERQHEGQVRAIATEALKDGLDRLVKHWRMG